MINSIFHFLSKHSLLISLIVLSICFFFFYPTTYISIDEHDYLYNGQNILNGTLKQECVSDQYSQFRVDNYCIYKYNIGTSIFYLPAILINMRLSFLTTFLFFCLGVYIFHRILKEFKIDTIFTALYAFYPTFVYFSRTLFSETYSATLVLLTFYFLYKFLKNEHFLNGLLGGIMLGTGVMVKYSNVVPMGIMLLGIIILVLKKNQPAELGQRLLQTFKSLLPIFLGILPLFIFFLLFNTSLYGHPLRSGYYYSGEEGLLTVGNILPLTIKYLGILLILYPGMFCVNFFAKNKYKWLLLTPAIATILFLSAYPTNNSVFEGRLLDLILGARFIVPIIPLLLILYSSLLNTLLGNKLIKITLIASILVLGLNVLLLNYIHQDFLKNFAFL